MSTLELMKQRYSCRKFLPTPVEQEKLELILEAGRVAPTATNRQAFHIWVFQTEDALQKVRATTTCHFDAPVILVVGAKTEDAWVREYDRKNFGDVDASIVATQIMLEIEEQGLGTTWVGWFDEGKLKEDFEELKDYSLIALFPIGYPDAKPSPKHEQRKSLEELVSYQ